MHRHYCVSKYVDSLWQEVFDETPVGSVVNEKRNMHHVCAIASATPHDHFQKVPLSPS